MRRGHGASSGKGRVQPGHVGTLRRHRASLRQDVPAKVKEMDTVQSLPGHCRRFPAFLALLMATDRRKR